MKICGYHALFVMRLTKNPPLSRLSKKVVIPYFPKGIPMGDTGSPIVDMDRRYHAVAWYDCLIVKFFVEHPFWTASSFLPKLFNLTIRLFNDLTFPHPAKRDTQQFNKKRPALSNESFAIKKLGSLFTRRAEAA
jgi:hypothetical protein